MFTNFSRITLDLPSIFQLFFFSLYLARKRYRPTLLFDVTASGLVTDLNSAVSDPTGSEILRFRMDKRGEKTTTNAVLFGFCFVLFFVFRFIFYGPVLIP